MGYGWKLCEKKKMMLDEKMGKVVKGEKKKTKLHKKRKRKRKVFLCVLKILC
jgi:hypothetical protein